MALSNEERSVVRRGHGEAGLAAFITAAPRTNLREVGIIGLVLSPYVCENDHGIAKAYLRVPQDVMGLRLRPRPSPALVGQPSLGRVTLPHLLLPNSKPGIATTPPPVFHPATMCRSHWLGRGTRFLPLITRERVALPEDHPLIREPAACERLGRLPGVASPHPALFAQKVLGLYDRPKDRL